MELPVNNAKALSLKLSEINSRDLLIELINNLFTGYLIVTIKTSFDLEEAILFFNHGTIFAASFESISFNKKVFGNKALAFCFNALKSLNGLLDIFSMDENKVDLITTFNKHFLIGVEKKSEIKKLIEGLPTLVFSEELFLRDQNIQLKEERHELIKKFGFKEI